MANHKSALKRARQSETKRLRNRAYKTRLKNAVRDVRGASDEASKEEKEKAFRNAVSVIQKSASRGVIPKKKAARKVSRLARLIQRTRSA